MKHQVVFEISSEILEKNPRFLDELEKAFNEVMRRAIGDDSTKSNDGHAAPQPEKPVSPPPFPLSEKKIRINGEPVGTEPMATIEEVAQYLNLKVRALRGLIERGRVPHYKIGRKLRFRMSEIEAWTTDKEVEIKKKPGRKPKG